MVVLEAVREQQVEPVRVPVLRRAEIGGAGGVRVLEAELAGGGVVLGDELVHLSVDAAVHRVRRLRIVQVALLLELLVDGHLVLGVHDVEGGVHRLQADGVFARVADVALARLALLGGDDDDARHRARTIDGGSGTVLQDVEGLDVVGVQAGDRGGDQGGGVTGAEIVRGDVHDVLHDHAVHDPQRLGRTVDGGGATDADLRRGAEGAGDVLDGHAGHLALQGAGDVGDTGQLRALGVHLGGGTGVEPAVDGLHTGGDGRIQDRGVVLQDELQGLGERKALILVSHAGGDDELRLRRDVLDGEVTVQVGHRSDGLVSLHIDGRSDYRLAARVDHGTGYRRLRRGEEDGTEQARQQQNEPLLHRLSVVICICFFLR